MHGDADAHAVVTSRAMREHARDLRGDPRCRGRALGRDEQRAGPEIEREREPALGERALGGGEHRLEIREQAFVEDLAGGRVPDRDINRGVVARARRGSRRFAERTACGRGERADVREPVRGLDRHRARDDVVDRGRHLDQGRGERAPRVQVQVLRHRVGRIVKRQLPDEQVEQQAAERVDVRARVDRLALDLFGRHAAGRAERFVRGRELGRDGIDELRDPEVEQDDPLRVVADEHVRRLEVAMDDAEVVRGRDRVAQRVEDLLHGLGYEAVPALDPRPEVLSVQALHAEVGAPGIVEAGIDDLDDVGMPQAPEDLDLAIEARGHLRAGQVRVQDLERGALPGRVVDRLVDGPEAAATELAADGPRPDALAGLVAVGEQFGTDPSCRDVIVFHELADDTAIAREIGHTDGMTRCPRCQRRLPLTGECAVHGKPSTLYRTVDGELPDAVAPAGYTLGRLIAVGGTALVYAVTSASGTPAILKWGRWRDRDMHARFAHEAEILASLGAPLTPTLVAHGAHDRWPYLLMEEVRGETLATWMARAGDRGSVADIVAILRDLATVLHALHARGIVHGDLKPENVVTGDVRLLDFGLASHEGRATTPAGRVFGTVHYLAPEQLRTGAVIDRRTDIYAFGVIAYEMLVGMPPFVGERRAIEYQHQVGRPTPLRDLRPIAAALDEFVLGCLAKQPEARPQTAEALLATLDASELTQTLKGVGRNATVRGARDKVVLAWIEGGDPITITRAVNDVHGIIVRGRPGAVLAAFAAQFHDDPVAVALAACRDLAHDRCRIVLHVTSALVRRSAQGKPAFYGPEIEQPASWAPATVFTGMVLTRAVAELAPSLVVPAVGLPGFSRAAKRDRTDATDVRSEVRLVGRDRLLQELAAIADGGGVLIGISGAEGRGKSRVLAALVERLVARNREVIAIRGRRRLVGDRPDDARLLDALGGGDDLAQALAHATTRKAIVVIDEIQWFSASSREQLLRGDLATTRVIASREPMFEVAQGMTKKIAIELPPLSFADSERLLRDVLEPARLIPDVLLQRLMVRANGNPGLLVALARDIKHRGGIRCHEGSDDWYVAADEIDTLNAAPGAAWLAARGLEGLAVEVAPIVRTGAALGPKFDAEELAAITELPAIGERLLRLVRDGVFAEKHGWYEFVDPNLQTAIYDHALDERTFVHARALRHWLARQRPDLVGWLARVAHHAAGCGEATVAAGTWTALAREARLRNETEVLDTLERRALAALQQVVPGALAEVMKALDERD